MPVYVSMRRHSATRTGRDLDFDDLALRFRRPPAGGQQRAEVVLLGHGGEPFEHVGEVDLRVVSIQFPRQMVTITNPWAARGLRLEWGIPLTPMAPFPAALKPRPPCEARLRPPPHRHQSRRRKRPRPGGHPHLGHHPRRSPGHRK